MSGHWGVSSSIVQELGIEPDSLEWLADVRGLERSVPREALRNYRYRWHAKRRGRPRLIESPKPRLKEIQRVLLRRVFDRIPPHPAAHGFRRHRSIRTATGAHVRKHTVLRVDLRDFFGSIRGSTVRRLFLSLGYDPPIAGFLTGFCTNRVPVSVFHDYPLREDPRARREAEARYRRVHLPQGAPCSPAIANLCAYWLDVRLSSLADSLRVAYTRYGDDMLFSGDASFGRIVRRFHVSVGAIALEQGFVVETRKTRIQRQGGRQEALGVVLNERPNVRRADFDRLKATLHNCRKHGPESQNRDAHPDFRASLLGRVAHVERLHPERGHRLREMFDRIEWA